MRASGWTSIPRVAVGLMAPLISALMVVSIGLPVDAGGRTDVLVTGPLFHWHPTPGYELAMHGYTFEIGHGGGGVATVGANNSFTVTLRRLGDCHLMIQFTARPGGNYVIRFDDHEVPRLEVTSGTDGAALAGRKGTSQCDLPDTTTAPSSVAESAPAGLLLAGAIIGVVLRPRRRKRPNGGGGVQASVTP
jgi:hypothetical protein